MALDPATGKALWQHKLMSGIATPVTYELDGIQYVVAAANDTLYAFAMLAR